MESCYKIIVKFLKCRFFENVKRIEKIWILKNQEIHLKRKKISYLIYRTIVFNQFVNNFSKL